MKSQIILSVHQPNYLPWLGYFNKIMKSDIFVILDDVQVPRGRSVANRNQIKGINANEILLTVPLKKAAEGIRFYNSATIDYEQSWQQKHIRNLQENYRKAEFFDEFSPAIFALLEKQYDNLAALNTALIMYFINLFGITTKIVVESEVDANLGMSNERIINLCKHFGADTYLSGQGARKYNDPELYEQSDITLTYQEYVHPSYRQLHGEFMPSMSVVDLVFNEGTNSVNIIAQELF
ncbi:WbqC family protein [Anabaena azotica]|uniref:WbqC family protein n=1 Tax=Anabaena azotica TaxID=197653 RepID=UPI0039A6C0F3